MFVEVSEASPLSQQLPVPPPLQLPIPQPPKNITFEQKKQRYSYCPNPNDIEGQGEPEDKTDYYLCPTCDNWTLHAEEQFHSKYHVSPILEGLYLGSALNSSSPNQIKKLSITSILNCSMEIPNYLEYNPDITYKNLNLKDSFGQTIRGCLQQCVQFITQSLKNSKNVLVHCAMGKSRSATVVIYYLMVSREYTLRQAYEYVMQRRPIITPNPSYVKELLQIELEMFGESSIKPQEIRPAYKHVTNW